MARACICANRSTYRYADDLHRSQQEEATTSLLRRNRLTDHSSDGKINYRPWQVSNHSVAPPQQQTMLQVNSSRGTHINPMELPLPRVRFRCQDEDIRVHFCRNAQGLIDSLQRDPDARTTSAQVAKKVLKYRHLMDRLGEIKTNTTEYDVSMFFGVEWCPGCKATKYGGIGCQDSSPP